MAQTSSPTVWRRWLALELRRLRRESGMSMQQVADEIGGAKGRLSFIESAERPVQPGDIDALLGLYDVPEERWPAYHRAARDARKKGWWERYDEATLPDWLSLYVGLEQGAGKLLAYAPHVVHGLLQTPDYAAAVMRADLTMRTEDRIAEMTQLRTERQAALTRHPDPLTLWVVLDETVLRRVVGNRETMRCQLEHIVKVADQLPNVIIQVLPFAGGANVGSRGPCAVLTFNSSGTPDRGVVYVEHYASSVYLEEPAEIERHTLVFQHLSAQAMSPRDSITTIRTAAEEFARD
jgi:transcriptional regulator with XRE-family HTH domain